MIRKVTLHVVQQGAGLSCSGHRRLSGWVKFAVKENGLGLDLSQTAQICGVAYQSRYFGEGMFGLQHTRVLLH